VPLIDDHDAISYLLSTQRDHPSAWWLYLTVQSFFIISYWWIIVFMVFLMCAAAFHRCTHGRRSEIPDCLSFEFVKKAVFSCIDWLNEMECRIAMYAYNKNNRRDHAWQLFITVEQERKLNFACFIQQPGGIIVGWLHALLDSNDLLAVLVLMLLVTWRRKVFFDLERMIIIASPSLFIFRAVRTFNVPHAIMLLQQQDSLASADRAFLGGRPNTRIHGEARRPPWWRTPCS
jgi:hypothetical protein